jgi:protein gp37
MNRLIARDDRIVLRTHDGTPVEYPQPKTTPKFIETQGDGVSWAWWCWNPVTGCLHDCPYCYARELALSARLAPFYPVGFTPLFHHERLDSPRVTPLPKDVVRNPAKRRVFVCSMADLYGNWVPDEWIDAVHSAMRDNPQWRYITLTKHPHRYTVKPPPPGAWIGASVDGQKRVSIVERTMARVGGAAVRWLSLEPLLEDLRFTDLSMFDWIVVGAQTETQQPDGKGGFLTVPAFAPPFEWVARLVAQAREAGCRVHLKPNLLGRTSRQSPGMTLPDEYPVEKGAP